VKQRHLGRSGLVVSRLALGTMTWGRDTDEDDAAAQLIAFREAGGTLVDTADVYAGGASERVLGRLLADVVPRDEVLVATKAYGATGSGPMGRGTSRGHLLSALDASLERLGTDHVDLWQLHAWDPVTPWEEAMAALDTAVASGRVRYAGVSNYSGWQLGATASWQRAWPGRAPLVANQVEYSLLQRGVEREVVPAAAALGVGLLPWSPLGRGVLTGKYRYGVPDDSRAASPHFDRFLAPYLDPRCGGIVESVATAADGLGAAPLAVALAWVRDRPGVSSVVLGARTAGQLVGALASERVELPAEIRLALDDVSLPVIGYPERSA
jgi:aryl-alcohol dehydrogenase-like predicted oxidoreductase